MKTPPLVTVVVPVYNTASYLRQCLDSILGQSLGDIEVVCVDDGSTDKSPEILCEYASSDNRVIVVNQENQYAGVARNHGIQVAQGEYVLFCDSDDYLVPRALEKLYAKCKEDNADVCVCGGRQYYEQINLEVDEPGYLRMSRVPDEVPFNRKTNQDYLFSFSTIMAYNKMFRLDFLRAHKIQYGVSRNGEDVVFSARALWLADRITVLNQGLVVYRIDRPDSLVGTLTASALGPLEAWVDVWKELGKEQDFAKRSFDNKVVGVIRHTFRNVKTAAAARGCYDYVTQFMLGELQIEPRPDDYYYATWANEFLEHLAADSFEDFLAFLSYTSARSIELESARKRDAKAKLKAQRKRTKEEKQRADNLRHEAESLKQEIERLRNSRSFRIGYALTKPFRRK